MIARSRGNSAEFVHEKLLADLQQGSYLPGDKLTTDSLSKRYEVSRTPVREALIRLEREGVVDATANSGYEIRTPTVDELCDMYEIREVIEGLAVAKLTTNGASPELIAELRDCCEHRRHAVNIDEKELSDRLFHTLICDNCGSETIQVLVHRYLVLSNIFNVSRYLFEDQQHIISILLKGRKNFNRHKNDIDVDVEHEQIVDAIEVGNSKLARKLLSAHIANARKLIQKQFGN